MFSEEGTTSNTTFTIEEIITHRPARRCRRGEIMLPQAKGCTT